MALRAVLAALPAGFETPVLVVQHMAPGFIDGLVGWMARELPLPVAVAADGSPLGPGILFAPDGFHMTLCRGHRVALESAPRVSGHCPSGDVLFHSIAATVGARSAAVVLTGMGRDGAAGLAAVGAAGGATIAQDEATSAVYGMPRAATEMGANVQLPVSEIGVVLAGIVR
jgi:two-component system chemotaxis response regulator CheB